MSVFVPGSAVWPSCIAPSSRLSTPMSNGDALQLDQTRVRGSESTGVEVEGAEMILEVDVQPLASGTARLRHGNGYELGPNPSVTCRLGDHRVLDPCMHETVPDHVDETDELGALSCNHPTEAMLALLRPVPLSLRVDTGLEGFGVKFVQLGVVEVTTPCAGDRHGLDSSSATGEDTSRRHRLRAVR